MVSFLYCIILCGSGSFLNFVLLLERHTTFLVCVHACLLSVFFFFLFGGRNHFVLIVLCVAEYLILFVLLDVFCVVFKGH